MVRAVSGRDEFNRRIIEEFRAQGGRLTSEMAVEAGLSDATILLLHHVGARTGVRRVTPLTYLAEGESFVICASRGGNPRHPDWYHNLMASPVTTIEVGTQSLVRRARLASGAERDRLWGLQKEARPRFREYEQRTTREIPVLVLDPLT